MKKQYPVIALAIALFAGSAIAAETPKGKQQTKMATCSKEAKSKSLKGAERKQFMSSCLKAKA